LAITSSRVMNDSTGFSSAARLRFARGLSSGSSGTESNYRRLSELLKLVGGESTFSPSADFSEPLGGGALWATAINLPFPSTVSNVPGLRFL